MRSAIILAISILQSDEQLLRADKVAETINVLGAALEENEAVGADLSDAQNGVPAEAPASSPFPLVESLVREMEGIKNSVAALQSLAENTHKLQSELMELARGNA